MVMLCVLAGCSSQKAAEPVTINVKVSGLSVDINSGKHVNGAPEIIRRAAEAFNKLHAKDKVTCNVEVFQVRDEDKAIKATFDKPNAPDVLFENYFNMSSYIYTGRVVPLDDIITPAMQQDIDEHRWQMSKVNGKTYMMPYYDMQNILAYEKSQMRAAGLDKFVKDDGSLQHWTDAEWEEILSTLAAKKPNGAAPLMMYAKNEQGDTHTMVYLRSKGAKFFDDKGNFHVNTPEGIQALRWLQEGNKKGYFPHECQFLQIKDCMMLNQNKKLTINVYNNAIKSRYPKEQYGYVNFPGHDGKGFASSFLSGFEVFDNKNAAKLKWSKEFIKFIYASDELMDYSAGALPVSKKVVSRFAEKQPELKLFAENSANIINVTGNNPNWRGVRNVFWVPIHEMLEGRLTPEQAAELIDKDCNAAIAEGRKNSKLHE